MSSQRPLGRRGPQYPTLPRGDVLGTYETYPEAQAVVARLAQREFPVAHVSIVGNDLKTVERVTGALSYGRVALAGALSGFWLGVFLGIVVTLFSGSSALGLIGAAAVIGAGFGMLYGVVSYSLTRRRRDFTSTHQVLASNYQVIVESQFTVRAQELLARP
ncbi:hypothetical protein GCM10025867_20810 [Frondihabitans sucicola]|uniref:General stress protein 17M-like domain-containing protein n=1 Tax=Frondihabitans sucicola TaxID=1268041 RepID=A0ABN6XXX6_9MICO|nr:general stress protein [Frondihabitans sucicola]BDZ49840.1 hypothetical protein GCM10025867_20810 [Frondihabitans sucicola]